MVEKLKMSHFLDAKNFEQVQPTKNKNGEDIRVFRRKPGLVPAYEVNEVLGKWRSNAGSTAKPPQMSEEWHDLEPEDR